MIYPEFDAPEREAEPWSLWGSAASKPRAVGKADADLEATARTMAALMLHPGIHVY